MRTLRLIAILSLLMSGAWASAKPAGPWQKAHADLKAGKVQAGLAQVSALKKSESTDIAGDALALLEGRALYQNKQYSAAIVAYRQVPKTSDLWLDSVEERAWASIRLGNMNSAIADTKTLLSPLFAQVVGPESFFVSAYIAHRVCDFETVFKISDTFKKNNRLKILHLEKMAKMEKTRGIVDLLNQISKKGLRRALSPDVTAYFPTHFDRDKTLQRLAQGARGKSLVQMRRLRTRLATLAERDLKHYKDVIQKLHLIEGDAIQRLYLDQQLAGQRQQLEYNKKKGKYDLEFPFEPKDIWVDEIDNLQVKAQTCPQTVNKGES